MDTTALLKASIQYQQSGTLNLLTHSRQDLDIMIEVIEEERIALQHMIDSNQYHIDNAEDMEEGLEQKLQRTIELQKIKLETLLAWRGIFFAAWQQVKQ